MSSSIDWKIIRDKVLETFRAGEVQSSPFYYVEAPNCLDRHIFDQMRSNLPEMSDGGMVPKNPASLTNKLEMNRMTAIIGKHPLSDQEKDKFWRTFCQEVILSEEFIKLLFSKFSEAGGLRGGKGVGKGVGKEVGDLVRIVGRKNELVYFEFGGQKYSAEATIYRDKGGYELEVHTDSPQRLLTAIWYLPDVEIGGDQGMSQYGTSLYTAKNPKFKDSKGVRLDFSKFEKVRTLPFEPGYAFSFLRSDQSFHAVEAFDLKSTSRDTVGIHVRKCKQFPKF